MPDWRLYRGANVPQDPPVQFPPPPPWRTFDGGPTLPVPAGEDDAVSRRLGDAHLAHSYRPYPEAVDVVNAALYLRRPVLVTGKPGSGKSSLAYAVANEVGLGPVLRWPISSRSSLAEGLYSYDAISRLQDVNLDRATGEQSPDIGDYLRLGPLGTALLPWQRPRVLLVDEIDKSDIDLPNDLLNLFEYGEYTVPELARVANRQPTVEVPTADGEARVPVTGGLVRCREFPFVLLTSNGERQFPPAFLRRCLQLELPVPDREQLAEIVAAHLGPALARSSAELLEQFVEHRREGDLAADQLLNAVYLRSFVTSDAAGSPSRLAALLMRHLDQTV